MREIAGKEKQTSKTYVHDKLHVHGVNSVKSGNYADQHVTFDRS